jgi:hypothetical protein
MRMVNVILVSALLAIGASFPLAASGTEEDLPAFKPQVEGWQSLTIEKGTGRIVEEDTRYFQVLFVNTAKTDRLVLQTMVQEFIIPTLQAASAAGLEFEVKREGTDGKLTVTKLSADTTISLSRATISDTQALGNNSIIDLSLESRSLPLPAFSKTGRARYVFGGYLNQPIASYPKNSGQIDYFLMQELVKLCSDLFPGGSAPSRGRVFLLQHRFVYASNANLGIRFLLVVEFY